MLARNVLRLAVTLLGAAACNTLLGIGEPIALDPSTEAGAGTEGGAGDERGEIPAPRQTRDAEPADATTTTADASAPACPPTPPVCAPTTIVQGVDRPRAVAANGPRIFWVSDAKVGGVHSARTDGTDPWTLAGVESPKQLAVDDARVYWTSTPANTLEATLLDGGARRTLAATLASPTGGVRASGGFVYVADKQGIRSAAPDLPDGGATLLVAIARTKVDLTVRGAHAYYMDLHAGVFRVDLGTKGPEEPVDSTTDEYSGLAVTNAWVYFGAKAPNAMTALYRCPLTGCAGAPPSTLATSQRIRSIVADAESLYWTDVDEGRVKRLPLDGGTQVTLASGLVGPEDIAVDASSVYWTAQDGTIRRVDRCCVP